MNEKRRLAAAFVADIKDTHQLGANEIVKQLSDAEVDRICQVRFAAAGELTKIEVDAAARRQKEHEREVRATQGEVDLEADIEEVETAKRN